MTAVPADASQSASGIVRKLDIDVNMTPLNMLQVESGMSRPGRWLSLSLARNVAEDYRRKYREAPGHIGGIVLVTETDTDTTSEKTSAFYGDINFSATGQPNQAR